MKVLFTIIVASVGLLACKNQEAPQSTATETSAAIEAPVTSVKLTKLWETPSELTTAESVYFDEKRGNYYVSCINGVPPSEMDGDGFIAIVSQDGKILKKDWATGLNAPKGMALKGNSLFVTDVNALVVIDVETGKVTERIDVAGAKFLNDVALGKDGIVYFTDSNSSKIHQYADGKVSLYMEGESLGGPNGLYVDDEEITLATFGSGAVMVIDKETKNATKTIADSVGGGDGVEPWKGGFLISDWNGRVFYFDANWKKTEVLNTIEEKLNAADITINQKAGELLVPTFFGNTVAAYKIDIL